MDDRLSRAVRSATARAGDRRQRAGRFGPSGLKRTVAAALGLGVALCAAPSTASLLDYVGQCVPFARAASGIQIYGDAWTWWDQADGRYQRGDRPRPGAVIVFARNGRLPLGHVAVVSRIVEKRVVLLTHANWSRVDGARGHAEQDVTLFDVSPANDWSSVKVWFRDSDGLGGTTYPVYGFIYGTPDRHAEGDALRARPSAELTGRSPDYVGALIDAYAH
jgi:surface antigen